MSEKEQDRGYQPDLVWRLLVGRSLLGLAARWALLLAAGIAVRGGVP